MEHAESPHDSDEFQIAKRAKGFKGATLRDENVCIMHAYSGALCSPGLDNRRGAGVSVTSRELAHC